MVDVATLGLAIDSSQAEKGALALDAFATSAKKAEQSADKMGAAAARSGKQAADATAEISAGAAKAEQASKKLGDAISDTGKKASSAASEAEKSGERIGAAAAKAATDAASRAERAAERLGDAFTKSGRGAAIGAGALADAVSDVTSEAAAASSALDAVAKSAARIRSDPIRSRAGATARYDVDPSIAGTSSNIGSAINRLSQEIDALPAAMASALDSVTASHGDLARIITSAETVSGGALGSVLAGKAGDMASVVSEVKKTWARPRDAKGRFLSADAVAKAAMDAVDSGQSSSLGDAVQEMTDAVIAASARKKKGPKKDAKGRFVKASATDDENASGSALSAAAAEAETKALGAEADKSASSVGALGDALKQTAKKAKESADATGLARHEMINLSRQAQDVVVSLAGGQNPLMVGLQQGSQIFDVFASSNAGAMNALRAFGAMALRVATNPLTILTAAVGTAGFAVMRFQDQQIELERSLNGVGRAAGVSAGQLAAIADATARSGALSRGQAVTGAAQFAQAGIGAENYATLLGDARRFSHAFGLDLADANQEIAKIVGDQGLGAFERRFGPVSLATKEMVAGLEQTGHFAEAARVKTALFDAEVQKAKDSTSLLSRGWEMVASAPGKALDGIGAGLDALLPKFQRIELPRQVQAALPSPGMGSVSDYERRIGLSQEVTQAQRERDRLDLNRRSELAGPLIDQLSPDDVQRRTMERQLAVLKPLTETADGLAALGDRADAAKRVVALLSTALANLQAPAERMRQDNALAVQSIEAYSFEQRAAVAAEQARITTLRQTHDETLAALAAEGARNAALAESSRRIDDMSRDASDRAQLRGLSPLQASLREIETRFARLREQNAPQESGRIGALQRQARIDTLSQSATQTMDQLRPDLAQRRQLEDARTAIREMLSDKDGLAALGPRADEAREAIDKFGAAIGLLRSPLERVTEANMLALRSAEAETIGQKAQIAAEQAFRAEMETSKDRLAAVTAAEGARNVVLLESARAMREQAKTAERRADLAGLDPYQRAIKEAQLTLQDDLKKANRAPGAGADMSIYDRSVVVPFDQVGNAATRLADAMDAAAARIAGPGTSGATATPGSAGNVVPFFARSGGDFYRSIMRAEGTDRFGDPYNTSLGYMRSPKPLVEMTMAESLAWGDQVRRAQGLNSSAKGAFQITNTTQRDAMRALGLGMNDMFSAENQNRMADWILRTQGIGAWEGFKRPGSAAAAQPAIGDQAGKIDEATEAYRKYDATIRAIKTEQVDNWLRDENRSLDEQRRAIDLASGAWGVNKGAIAAAEEQQKLLNEAQRLGIPITEELTSKIEKLSQKAADNATAQDQQRRRVASYDLTRSGVADIAGGSALAFARGEDVGAAAKDALGRMAENMMRQSIGNIVESFMGAMGSDSLGPLGSLLGIGGSGEKNAANVNIKAANVNLSGAGLGGTGGLLDKIVGGGGDSGGGFLGGIFSGIGDFLGGLFKFENGGIMTSAGALPLHRYATGGIADRPQLALFGEGRGPEAFVPLPDGRRIPVHMTAPPAAPPQIINFTQQQAAPKFTFNNYAPGVEAIPRTMSDGEIIVEIRKTAATMIAVNNKRQAEASKRAI